MVQRFGDIFEIIDGDRGKNYPQDKDFFDSGYCLFLSANNVTKDGWRFDKCQFITNEKSKILRKGLVSRGDIIFTSRGTVGNVALYDDSVSYDVVRINSGMVILREKDANNIYNKYAYYILKSPSTKQLITYYCSGSAQPQLPIKDFVKIKVDTPSLPIQRKIASILSTYDNLIENNTKRIKLLEQMAENLYKEWFVRFRFPGHENVEMENGLPKGWKKVRLDSFADILMGQSPESQYYNTDKIGLPFHQGVGSYGEWYLVDTIYSTKGNKIAEPNSIIFSVRAPVGRINLTKNRIILGRGVCSINSKNGFDAFLLWCLKNKFAMEDSIGNGSIFTSVNKEELCKQKIVIPNMSLLNKFNEFASNLEHQIRNITEQNYLLTHQRDLLLPRLMSGKLEVC